MRKIHLLGILFPALALSAFLLVQSCRKAEVKNEAENSYNSTGKKETAKVSLVGNTGMHDPSTIVKRNGVYHIWGTGNQIYHLTSTDLIKWTVGPTVFPAGTYPAWTTTVVPDFTGHFWAPECVFMNNRYYMYYSVSTGGSLSAIGVATSTDLTNWTDQGLVISSKQGDPYGTIDPAVFKDSNGKWWLAFGSHRTGIWAAELDPATGKRVNTVKTQLSGNSGASVQDEAAYVIRSGGYYYLFYNVGTCCDGVNSTYRVKMGRSTNPMGPYVDKNGVSLLSGGGTIVLSASGNYIGPGHIGLYTENGYNFTTYHYYSGSENGYPRVAIGNMGFSNGWPYITQDWIPSGRYQVTNANSGKVWDAWGCTGAAGQAIAQNTITSGLLCQQWDFTALGNGEYRINSAQGGRSVDVVNCGSANGSLLDLWDWNGLDCQKFRIERTGDGKLVFTSLTGNRVVEVPGASTSNGTQLGLYDYNGGNQQKWSVSTP